MKYICLGYIKPGTFEGMTEGERNAMFDTSFEYDDRLRANGHWAGGEAFQPPQTALTLYWKNGKVATERLRVSIMTDTCDLARNLAALRVSVHREPEQLKKIEPAKLK